MEIGTVYPEYQVASIGSNITINCESVTPVKWKKGDFFLQTVNIFNSLIIAEVTDDDSGLYTCYGRKSSIIEQVPFAAYAMVKVAGKIHNINSYTIIFPCPIILTLSVHKRVKPQSK